MTRTLSQVEVKAKVGGSENKVSKTTSPQTHFRIQSYRKELKMYWNYFQDLMTTYCIGYSESKYCLRMSLMHPQDRHFAHMPWLPVSIEKPQTPFREIRVMFVPVR